MSAVIERPAQAARVTRAHALRHDAPACPDRPGPAGAFARARRDL